MVQEAIQTTIAQFVDAFNRGDLTSALAIYYAEEARVLPGHSPIISGKHAIQEFWQGTVIMGLRRITIETAEVSYSGDLAYEIGNCLLDIQPAEVPGSQDICKSVVVWKQQAGGAWKVVVDSFSSNTPLPNP